MLTTINILTRSPYIGVFNWSVQYWSNNLVRWFTLLVKAVIFSVFLELCGFFDLILSAAWFQLLIESSWWKMGNNDEVMILLLGLSTWAVIFGAGILILYLISTFFSFITGYTVTEFVKILGYPLICFFTMGPIVTLYFVLFIGPYLLYGIITVINYLMTFEVNEFNCSLIMLILAILIGVILVFIEAIRDSMLLNNSWNWRLNAIMFLTSQFVVYAGSIILYINHIGYEWIFVYLLDNYSFCYYALDGIDESNGTPDRPAPAPTIIVTPDNHTHILCKLFEAQQDNDAAAYAMAHRDDLRVEWDSRNSIHGSAAAYHRQLIEAQFHAAAHRSNYWAQAYVPTSPMETLSALHIAVTKMEAGEDVVNVVHIDKMGQQRKFPADTGEITHDNINLNTFEMDKLREDKVTATGLVIHYTEYLTNNVGHTEYDSPNVPTYNIYTTNPEALGQDIVNQQPNVANAELGLRLAIKARRVKKDIIADVYPNPTAAQIGKVKQLLDKRWTPNGIYQYRERFIKSGLGVKSGKGKPFVAQNSGSSYTFNNVSVPRMKLQREPTITIGNKLSSILKRIVPMKRS